MSATVVAPPHEEIVAAIIEVFDAEEIATPPAGAVLIRIELTDEETERP